MHGALFFLRIFKTPNKVYPMLTDILYPGYDVHAKYARTCTGTGTKFGGDLSLSPTFLKYQMDIYWPIMKTQVTNNEYSLHSM